LGIFAAFAVYRRIDALLDVCLGLVGLQCAVLVVPRLAGPVDLSNRLNPAALGGRNDFAAFLMVLIVLRISVWAYDRERPPWYVIGSLSFMLIAMILTLARSPVVGLVCGLVAVLASALRRRGVSVKSAASAAAIAGVVSPVLARPTARARLTSLSLANSSGRSDIWSAALRLFRQRPLVGHGLGSFNITSPHIVENFVTSSRFTTFDPAVGQPTSSAHNVVLQVLAEGGIVGFAVVAWSVYYLLRTCWHSVLLAVVVAIFVDSLFDTFVYVVQVSWVLGLVFATGLCLRSAEAPAGPPSDGVVAWR
jgi:O-antigen ligase